MGAEVKKLSQRERIIVILSDGKWHCARQLHQIGWRYSARLHEIRKDFALEKRPCQHADCAIEDWRFKR